MSQTIASRPGSGVFVRDSSVFLHDCTLVGGTDITGGFLPNPGASGLSIFGGDVFADGCTFSGGGGGEAVLFQGCNAGGDGGHGVDLLTAASSFVYGNSTMSGGPGGVSVAGCSAGASGMSVHTVAGATVTALGGGVARGASILAPGPVREQQSTTLTIDATAGDSIWLGIAPSSQPAFFAPFDSSLVLGPALQSVFLGTVPTGDVLALPLTASSLPLGVDALTVFLQPIGIGAGAAFLGGGQSLTILRAGI